LNPDLVEAIEQMGARFDGKGKPAMTGESIHQYARMLAVCDVYDFLDRRRAGDKGTPGKGRQALEAQKGKWLDPVIVDVFLSDKP
jgi:response regulator RpfG family c-di-GMP phosphodiesterase